MKGLNMSGTNIFDDTVVGTAGATILGSGQVQANSYAGQFSSLAQSWHAQQQQQYNQALMAQQMQTRQHQWMVNGKTMDFAEFLDTICPEEDDPMRTFLTLKYKGMK
jgi:hypothetical protein